MDMNQYQKHARTTAIYPHTSNPIRYPGLEYTVLGLVGESGEVAQILKKFLRDGGELPELRDKIQAELGDVLWYVAMIAEELGISLGLVALTNLNKLHDRQKRGVIGGSGDAR